MIRGVRLGRRLALEAELPEELQVRPAGADVEHEHELLAVEPAGVDEVQLRPRARGALRAGSEALLRGLRAPIAAAADAARVQGGDAVAAELVQRSPRRLPTGTDFAFWRAPSVGCVSFATVSESVRPALRLVAAATPCRRCPRRRRRRGAADAGAAAAASAADVERRDTVGPEVTRASPLPVPPVADFAFGGAPIVLRVLVASVLILVGPIRRLVFARRARGHRRGAPRRGSRRRRRLVGRRGPRAAAAAAAGCQSRVAVVRELIEVGHGTAERRPCRPVGQAPAVHLVGVAVVPVRVHPALRVVLAGRRIRCRRRSGPGRQSGPGRCRHCRPAARTASASAAGG
mmetsp:Transcript_129367/g.362144  ORF Transcript_129367/g.362144 Transcript_129367/m.362144 type:complete len:346 (+) Transcript_129367:626-1663(+)